jgi:hypothetical protein
LILPLSDREAEKRLFGFNREKWKKNMEGKPERERGIENHPPWVRGLSLKWGNR